MLSFLEVGSVIVVGFAMAVGFGAGLIVTNIVYEWMRRRRTAREECKCDE
ncbi:hypothetical protein MTAT_04430 [Moorella thermoacetica]|uniref:Uncharacterized protein n=1 Tax=Neomoorella thermoacetica TaxID=1525 RepID=A0AAC9HIY4_NEOTH|nr:hypothetical protein Maut_02330 [Moorella thermoacetica]TYL15704.1 hypothetical protein MTAT_04430 [Moorella thermoacetica]